MARLERFASAFTTGSTAVIATWWRIAQSATPIDELVVVEVGEIGVQRGDQLVGVLQRERPRAAVRPIERLQRGQLGVDALASGAEGAPRERRETPQQLARRDLASSPNWIGLDGHGIERENAHFDTIAALDNFDLHNHSTCSDGLLSPTQLIELAARTGVDAIALTDHDTTDGLEEAAIAANQAGVVLVPGVEISVSWGDTTLHVVGLQIDAAAPELVAGLESIRVGRDARARQIAAALETMGFAGTFERRSRSRRTSRCWAARISRGTSPRPGRVKNIQAAFDKYLAKGKPAYVSHQWAELEDAIGWIRAAGGVAVLAHPGRYDLKPMFREEMLKDFRAAGGEAIEVVTGSHRPEQYAMWQRVALEHGFLASRGADYHGPGESPVEPGRLPALHASLTPVWSKWAH